MKLSDLTMKLSDLLPEDGSPEFDDEMRPPDEWSDSKIDDYFSRIADEKELYGLIKEVVIGLEQACPKIMAVSKEGNFTTMAFNFFKIYCMARGDVAVIQEYVNRKSRIKN